MNAPLAAVAVLALAASACSASPPAGSGNEAAPAADATPAASPPASRPREAPPISDPLPAIPMTCDAEKAKGEAIGQPATEANVERARIASGAESVRVIPPGTMVTLEFVESRLNVDVDADNVITDLRCG